MKLSDSTIANSAEEVEFAFGMFVYAPSFLQMLINVVFIVELGDCGR